MPFAVGLALAFSSQSLSILALIGSPPFYSSPYSSLSGPLYSIVIELRVDYDSSILRSLDSLSRDVVPPETLFDSLSLSAVYLACIACVQMFSCVGVYIYERYGGGDPPPLMIDRFYTVAQDMCYRCGRLVCVIIRVRYRLWHIRILFTVISHLSWVWTLYVIVLLTGRSHRFSRWCAAFIPLPCAQVSARARVYTALPRQNACCRWVNVIPRSCLVSSVMVAALMNFTFVDSRWLTRYVLSL